jgi:hypothetical protein
VLHQELDRTDDRERLLGIARSWLYEHRLITVHERLLRSMIAVRLKAWVICVDCDHTAKRISAKQCPLWSIQNFNSVEIVKLRLQVGDAHSCDIINQHDDTLICAAGVGNRGIAPADSTKIESGVSRNRVSLFVAVTMISSRPDDSAPDGSAAIAMCTTAKDPMATNVLIATVKMRALIFTP